MSTASAIAIYSLLCVIGFSFTYFRFRDIFHPACIGSLFCLVTISGGWLSISSYSIDAMYPYNDFTSGIYFYSFCYVAFLGGTLFHSYGHFSARYNGQRQIYWPLIAKDIRRVSYILFGLSFTIYILQLNSGGGFFEVYSQVKGKGDLGSGINDFIYLCVPATAIYILSIGNRKMDIRDWIIIAIIISPILLTGILSSRRGPTAMGFGAVGFSYCLIRNYRPSLIVFLTASFLGGCFLLFLVAFRGQIFLGSDLLAGLSMTEVQSRIGEFVGDPAPGHEFVYSSTVMTNANIQSDYWYGLRYVLATTIWLVPSMIFPDKYVTLGAEGMLYNGGTSGRIWTDSINAPGAAPMFFADTYIEFGIFAVFFVFAFGWWIGRRWIVMRQGDALSHVLYVCILTLMIYLYSQAFSAFAQRLIVMSLPTWFLWHVMISPKGKIRLVKRASHFADLIWVALGSPTKSRKPS